MRSLMRSAGRPGSLLRQASRRARPWPGGSPRPRGPSRGCAAAAPTPSATGHQLRGGGSREGSRSLASGRGWDGALGRHPLRRTGEKLPVPLGGEAPSWGRCIWSVRARTVGLRRPSRGGRAGGSQVRGDVAPEAGRAGMSLEGSPTSRPSRYPATSPCPSRTETTACCPRAPWTRGRRPGAWGRDVSKFTHRAWLRTRAHRTRERPRALLLREPRACLGRPPAQ